MVDRDNGTPSGSGGAARAFVPLLSSSSLLLLSSSQKQPALLRPLGRRNRRHAGRSTFCAPLYFSLLPASSCLP